MFTHAPPPQPRLYHQLISDPYTNSMKEFPASKVIIRDPFWTPKLLLNATVSIFHQWEQLEMSRCIDNIRLVAGEKEGFREGWFFADSDAYKWLDAAARIYASWPSELLREKMDGFIDIITRAQMADGYIYTYNQLHFPGERWGNLMIEHELYCFGHLIEAGVSHFESTGELGALQPALKAANLLVNEFLVASPDKTSGHEEIEIALLRLYQATNNIQYLELAQKFLERRGKVRPFVSLILQQNARVAERAKDVRDQRKIYLASHPDQLLFILPPENYAKKPRAAKLRLAVSALSGKYFQQHVPIRQQTVPVGHSVRFTYLETAIAMLHRHTGDSSLLPALEQAWKHMVTRRMFVTGGIGSLPELEGFGRDYELEPEIAYAETCAALGSLFWNWEMVLNTGNACYSDLFEWQLYNAAAVGMGLGGDSYLYNNPLLCWGGVTRRPWFKVPCCPSNLSRTWAALGKYIYSFDEKNLWVHQYIGNQTSLIGSQWQVKMESGLPWNGSVHFSLAADFPTNCVVNFRIPSWAGTTDVLINGEPFIHPATINRIDYQSKKSPPSVTGIDPSGACYLPIEHDWLPEDEIDIRFEMPIILRTGFPRSRGHKNEVALTRGPIVYCLKNVDNPSIDIFESRIMSASISVEYAPSLLGGTWILSGETSEAKRFIAIPYYLWANRGESQMTVWIKT